MTKRWIEAESLPKADELGKPEEEKKWIRSGSSGIYRKTFVRRNGLFGRSILPIENMIIVNSAGQSFGQIRKLMTNA
ncbi:MAG: hypothetical protein IKG97_05535 [Lachnospiraceae bacterium]|nr:hypothetical protein [Lachnospiraceae bacterium]